jgi:hypothetical protein
MDAADTAGAADAADAALDAAATPAASGPRLVLDLKQILCEVPDADEYDTRLTGQLDAALAEALPAFGACALTHFDGVEHGVVLSRVYAAASHAARNDTNTLYYALRTRHNSAALLTLQRIEALRGTCADCEDSPLAMLFLLRDTQLVLTNAQLRCLTKGGLVELICAMERATVRCPVCADFLYEKKMTTLPCGHSLHTDCYAILAAAGSAVACPSCTEGDQSKPAVVANMTADAFHSQMQAVESTLSNLSVSAVEEVDPVQATPAATDDDDDDEVPDPDPESDDADDADEADEPEKGDADATAAPAPITTD